MNYLKNSAISKEFAVADSTVGRWIKNAKSGNNNLQLYQVEGKDYILDSHHNRAIMDQLAKRSVKYRSKSNLVEVKPNKEFYETYSEQQIVEIINGLEQEQKIEHKFSYLGRGGSLWEKIYKEDTKKGIYQTPIRLKSILDNTFDFLKYQISEFGLVNIIDIGPGDSEPVKDLISKLLELKKLRQYITIDISKSVNEISSQNIQKWFPALKHTHYVHDVDKNELALPFFKSKLAKNSKKQENICNLILYLGSSIGNHDNPEQILHNIKKSMDKKDLLFVSNTIESKKSRTELKFLTTNKASKILTWLPETLGIDTETCQFEYTFSSPEEGRNTFLNLDKSYLINFEILGRTKKVYLDEGQKIRLWRHKMTNLETLPKNLNNSGLQLIHLAVEKDISHALFGCRVME